jgi:hypothetical protein
LLDDSTTTVTTVVTPRTEPAAFAQSKRLSINQIYRQSAPGVVQITTTSVRTVEPDPFLNPFGFPEQQQEEALGSGTSPATSSRTSTSSRTLRRSRSASRTATASARGSSAAIPPPTWPCSRSTSTLGR